MRLASHRQQSGFTAVEMMVVLVVVGIMLAASVPAFVTSMRSSSLQDAATSLGSRIRLTRTRAVTENVQYLVTWAGPGNTYFLVRDEDGDEISDPGELKEGPFTLPNGINMRNHPDDPFSGRFIALRPTGSANESGSLQFINENGKTARLSVLQSSAMFEVFHE